MSTIFKAKPLPPDAIEMLGQLFTNGPTWDGNVVSKAGRGYLFEYGLAYKVEGFTALTPEGLRVAIEWKENTPQWRQSKWYCKINDIPWPRKSAS